MIHGLHRYIIKHTIKPPTNLQSITTTYNTNNIQIEGHTPCLQGLDAALEEQLEEQFEDLEDATADNNIHKTCKTTSDN